jgi:hypothetical protein
MWANSAQGEPPGGVFRMYCRPRDETTVLPGTECLHPRIDLLEFASEASLQVERSDNDSHSFDTGGRRSFHLDIVGNPMNDPARASDGDTSSQAVVSLESLAQRLILGSTATTNGRETSPNNEGDDIDELVGSYSQGR